MKTGLCLILLEAMFALFRKFVQIYKMHRLILGLACLFFIASGCRSERPEGILPEEVMAEMLSEVHLLDGYISNMPSDSAKKVIDPLYNQLFSKYGLDSVSFTRNVDYYLGNPISTQSTYDRVIENLEEEEKLFLRRDSLAHVVTQDSLRRVTRLTNRANLSNQMIMDVAADSVEMSIAEATKRLYENSGIQTMWEPYTQRPSTGDPSSADNQAEAAREPITEEPVPARQPDTVSAQSRDLQFKPVVKPRR